MIFGAIAVACIGWAFTFGVPWGNFWIKIGITVLCASAYALAWRRPRISFAVHSITLGVLSAATLYGVFFLGNTLAPYIMPGAHAEVAGIYNLGSGMSRVWVMLLLLFITGPGEEIFWRGFLQEELERKWGAVYAWLTASAIYGGVHIFSGNPMLIAAALVAGLFWGGLYAWKKDLAALIVSHSLWSAFIFAVFPVH